MYVCVHVICDVIIEDTHTYMYVIRDITIENTHIYGICDIITKHTHTHNTDWKICTNISSGSL